MDLAPCTGCRRHLRVEEPRCRFCGTEVSLRAGPLPMRRLSRAGMIAFALASGCDKEPTVTKEPASASPATTASASAVASAAPSGTGNLADSDSGFGLPGLALGGDGGLGSLTSPAAAYGGGPPPLGAPTLPAVDVTTTAATGVADADAVITKNRARYRACTNKALAFDPSVKGEVTLSVTTDSTGEATSAKVEKSTTGLASLDACIAAASRTLKFAGKGTVRFSVKITPK